MSAINARIPGTSFGNYRTSTQHGVRGNRPGPPVANGGYNRQSISSQQQAERNPVIRNFQPATTNPNVFSEQASSYSQQAYSKKQNKGGVVPQSSYEDKYTMKDNNRNHHQRCRTGDNMSRPKTGPYPNIYPNMHVAQQSFGNKPQRFLAHMLKNGFDEETSQRFDKAANGIIGKSYGEQQQQPMFYPADCYGGSKAIQQKQQKTITSKLFPHKSHYNTKENISAHHQERAKESAGTLQNPATGHPSRSMNSPQGHKSTVPSQYVFSDTIKREEGETDRQGQIHRALADHVLKENDLDQVNPGQIGGTTMAFSATDMGENDAYLNMTDINNLNHFHEKITRLQKKFIPNSSMGSYSQLQGLEDDDIKIQTNKNTAFFSLRQGNKHRKHYSSSYMTQKDYNGGPNDNFVEWNRKNRKAQLSSVSAARNFDEPVTKLNDKTKFFAPRTMNNYSLSCGIVDKLIGPPPPNMVEELKHTHILDKNTVKTIKQAKEKVNQENNQLKQKVGQIKSVLSQASNENSRLRSQIRVLIQEQDTKNIPQPPKGYQMTLMKTSTITDHKKQNMDYQQSHIAQSKGLNDSMKLQSEYEIANGTEGIFHQDFDTMGPNHGETMKSADERGLMSNLKPSTQLSLVISGAQHMKTPFQESPGTMKRVSPDKSGLELDSMPQKSVDNGDVPLQSVAGSTIDDIKAPLGTMQKSINQENQNGLRHSENDLTQSTIKTVQNDHMESHQQSNTSFTGQNQKFNTKDRKNEISFQGSPPKGNQVKIDETNVRREKEEPSQIVLTPIQEMSQRDQEYPPSFNYLNKAFQVTDIMREELENQNKAIEKLRQQMAIQEMVQNNLKNENFRLKQKVDDQRREVAKKPIKLKNGQSPVKTQSSPAPKMSYQMEPTNFQDYESDIMRNTTQKIDGQPSKKKSMGIISNYISSPTRIEGKSLQLRKNTLDANDEIIEDGEGVSLRLQSHQIPKPQDSAEIVQRHVQNHDTVSFFDETKKIDQIDDEPSKDNSSSSSVKKSKESLQTEVLSQAEKMQVKELKLKNQHYSELLNKREGVIRQLTRDLKVRMNASIQSEKSHHGQGYQNTLDAVVRKDQIAESIESMVESSKDMVSLFRKVETCIIRIMGKYCKKVNFMILDENFIKEIKTFDREEQHFQIRKLTIGPDFADMIRLRDPAPHPYKKKATEYWDEEEDRKQANRDFNSFIPDFNNLEKVTQNAIIKSSSVIFPVFNLKKKAGAQLHNNCKFIIQIDIPRDKLNQSANYNLDKVDTAFLETHNQGQKKKNTLKITRQPTVAVPAQVTQALVIKPAPQILPTVDEEVLRSFDCIKQLRLVVNCFVLQLEQVRQEERANHNGHRVTQILSTMQIFMKAKRHEDLYQDLTDYLPKLFNFEKAGIMFMDHTTGFLYSINENEDGADPSKHEEISRYPINMGLTGICLEEREPLITLEGEDDPRFSFEVDNILRLLDVESLLIVPLIDSQNRLQGAIQMINKLDADEIPKEDVVELLQICPSIAEVLTFCELAKDVQNVSDGLVSTMQKTKDNIEGSSHHFQIDEVPDIMTHLGYINKQVQKVVKNNREGTFNDGTMLTKILHDMQKQQEFAQKAQQRKSVAGQGKKGGAPKDSGRTQQDLEYE